MLDTNNDELRVLHIVSMKGRLQASVLASCLALDPAAVDVTLRRLSGLGLVGEAGPMWRITDAGRSLMVTASRETRALVGADVVEGWHDVFLGLNGPFLELVTRWQLKNGALNRHDDPGYDRAILAALQSIHTQVLHLLAVAGQLAPELQEYQRRLSGAWASVRGGNSDWLVGPLVDSYHTIWFELHQYFIEVTGRARGE